MSDKGIIYVVGMGPGNEGMMTLDAINALETSDVIVGYTVYLELLDERFKNKELISTPMKREVERCRICFEKALLNKTVSMICSGDSGVYGMASLMLELAPEYGEVEVKIIPGITAALSGSAVLGAPLGHDFCVISLSDLLTPFEIIENRLRCAAKGDFCIVIYNPSSRKRADYLRRACEILLEDLRGDTPCGIVENIGRPGERYNIMTLSELMNEDVNMFTTVFVGNLRTKIIDGRLVTPRGYSL